MAEQAKVIKLPGALQRIPDTHARVRGKSRAIAVAKFRELADKLERGELDGARVQWLAPGDAQVSEMQTVTRSARDHVSGAGTVRLTVTAIEEI